MPKYQLLARAQFHGAIREPGYVFELAEGEKGPHRTVVASNHGAQIAGQDVFGDVKDVPLYVEYKEPKTEEPEAEA